MGTNSRAMDAQNERPRDAAALDDKLEQVMVPLFEGHRHGCSHGMRHALALNGSFGNTQRIMQQYVVKAYFR